MKRWIVLPLTAAMLLCCAACGTSSAAMQPVPPSPSVSQPAEEPAPVGNPSTEPNTPVQSPQEPSKTAPKDTASEQPPPPAPAPKSDGEKKEKPAAQQPASAEVSPSPVDIDLTALSSTMVYAEVFNMLSAPNDYDGKKLRMKGNFSVYQDPDTQKIYCGVLVQDATACCTQGIDVIMPSQSRYPDDYPPAQSEVTVVGTIRVDRTLAEYGIYTLHLENICFENSEKAL